MRIAYTILAIYVSGLRLLGLGPPHGFKLQVYPSNDGDSSGTPIVRIRSLALRIIGRGLRFGVAQQTELSRWLRHRRSIPVFAIPYHASIRISGWSFRGV